LGTLNIDTAGASVLRPLHIVNLPIVQAQALSESLLASSREARSLMAKAIHQSGHHVAASVQVEM
jgi:hypothetical protein